MSSTNRCPLPLDPYLQTDRKPPRLADFLRAVPPSPETPQGEWQGGSGSEWTMPLPGESGESGSYGS